MTSIPEGRGKIRGSREHLKEEIDQRLELGREILSRIKRYKIDEIQQTSSDFDVWDEFNEELLRARFTIDEIARWYRSVAPVTYGRFAPPVRIWKLLEKGINERMRRLSSVQSRLELYESEDSSEASRSSSEQPYGTQIFIVHGHDGETKYEIAEFLEKTTGHRPVILHEQPDSGRTIIEKFEDYASDAGFAIVLLTADDHGREKSEEALKLRARQNVILELGFFIGRLGRSRVAALYETGVELPSDLLGVLWKPLAGNWHTALAVELRAADIECDLDKL